MVAHTTFPRRLFLVILLCVTIIVLVAGYGFRFMNGQEDTLSLGQDICDHLVVMENHKQALSHWAAKGVRNAVLVNLDAHDDIGRISPEKMDQIGGILARVADDGTNKLSRDLGTLVGDADFIYAAAKFGIVREVYWVVPFFFQQTPDIKGRLINMLGEFGFSLQDIGTFTMRGDRFSGEIDGISLHLCDLDSLPEFQEPVLLSIDVDFIPVMAANTGERLIDAVRGIVNGLARKEFQVGDVSIAYSSDGAYVSTCHRWVGDLIVDLLGHPIISLRSQLPGHYEFLQRAERLRAMGRHGDLLDLLTPFLDEDFITAPALMYAAFACSGSGAVDQAFEYAEAACEKDRNYCTGLPEIGSEMLYTEGIEAAERFFVEGYRRNPDMARGQFKLALAMKKAGRYDDALHYFNMFRKLYGTFPVDFYIAETQLLNGNDSAALGYFNSARQQLLIDAHAWSAFGDERVVRRAIDFYERKGYENYAGEMQLSLALKEKNYPGHPDMMRQ
ncbi:tetratricopeptide repeat protein [Thermodesulfobacteriota bacterium]